MSLAQHLWKLKGSGASSTTCWVKRQNNMCSCCVKAICKLSTQSDHCTSWPLKLSSDLCCLKFRRYLIFEIFLNPAWMQRVIYGWKAVLPGVAGSTTSFLFETWVAYFREFAKQIHRWSTMQQFLSGRTSAPSIPSLVKAGCKVHFDSLQQAPQVVAQWMYARVWRSLQRGWRQGGNDRMSDVVLAVDSSVIYSMQCQQPGFPQWEAATQHHQDSVSEERLECT